MKISRILKEKMNTGKPIDSERLISLIRDYDVVTFDIFDTLLKRNVSNPSDVFEYIGKKIGNLEFAQKRIQAEIRARGKKKDKEVTLLDIYKEYGEDYSRHELEAEEELLVVNNDILPVFQYCVENKRVALISDMYLPEIFLSEVLEREGITGYEKLYLSSSLKKTKQSGDLFRYVLEDMGIENKKILHIGDSFSSDYRVPKEIGMDVFHLPTRIKRDGFRLKGKSLEEDIINNFINNTVLQCSDPYYRFGYEKFGMFLWGYVKWIHDSVLSAGIDRIYFFSRDGFIMKEAFDSLYSDVNTQYLEVSRRALRVPILWKNLEFDYLIDMLSPSKFVSLAMIFDGVGLDIHDYQELIKAYGFELSTYFVRDELWYNDKIRDLYRQLTPDIESVSKKEYELLKKYILQNQIRGRFAVVDIGWSGGMQRYLCETLEMIGVEHEIKGLYVGVADYYKRNQSVVPDLDLNGYLFDFLHYPSAVDPRSSFVGLFETLFLEQAGSVVKYVEENGMVIGKRSEYEYLQNGEPSYELQSVKRLQAGALDFVKKFGDRSICVSPEILFKGIEETGVRPTRRDLKLFGDFRFFDEGETQYLATPQSLLRYIFHPGDLKRDFLLCRWKIGFMKKLIRLPFPYLRIYKYLLKFK